MHALSSLVVFLFCGLERIIQFCKIWLGAIGINWTRCARRRRWLWQRLHYLFKIVGEVCNMLVAVFGLESHRALDDAIQLIEQLGWHCAQLCKVFGMTRRGLCWFGHAQSKLA